MSLLDQLGGLLGNLSGGKLTEDETNSHYDQMAKSVPPQQLGTAIGPALGSLDNQELQSRVASSAREMSPQQRGGLVESLLGALGSGSTVGSSGLRAILSQLGVNQDVANDPQSASPEEVGKLAAHAKDNDPGVFQQAMSFYSQHPTLVKALGTVVIAQIAQHLVNSKK